jgi:sec-independent protein translocase protein TatA
MFPIGGAGEMVPMLVGFGTIGNWELLVLLVLGVLLFGKRLPEVGRSLGKGIVEFKKGLRGIEDEIDDASTRQEAKRSNDRVEVDSPKFEIPPAGSFEKSDRPA